MSESNPPRSRDQVDRSVFGESHVRLYQETKGEQGYDWNGTHILLLTTKGRKSGQMHTTPLIFVEDGDPVIIASKGGAPEHPAWYQNLQADPHAKVQIKGEVFDAVAKTVSGPDRARLWAEGVKAWPLYEDYQRATEREIPVVKLERKG